VANACGYEKEVETVGRFYMAGSESYVEKLAKMPASLETIMVVGHNPGVAELVEDLTTSFVRMPTAALAQVRLPIDTWADLDLDTEGELINYWEPREIA
jgi:phosphohistidine phosphatase